MDEPRQVAYSPRYREPLVGLLGKTPYKLAIWQWQFEDNPFTETFSPVVFTDHNDQVIGFNGVMAIKAVDRGIPIDALWSCDFYVAAEWRGKRLGSQIKQILNTKAEIIMALGVSDKACQVLTHLGWKRYTHIYSYRLVRRWDTWRTLAFRGLQAVNRVSGAQARTPENLELTVNSQLPPQNEVDELWECSKYGFRKIVARTYTYLNWKYQQHPLANYAFVIARQDGQLSGIFVVRYHNGVLRIIDYCGPARDRALKRALIRCCRKHWQHAKQLTVVTSDDELGNCLRNEGFFRARSRPRFFIRPTASDITGETNENDWFIMSGDSDGELLLAANEKCAGEKPE